LRQPVTQAQFEFARIVDAALAGQDRELFTELSSRIDASLSWIPFAVTRWILEKPDSEIGRG
jgi:hypothetical protein